TRLVYKHKKKAARDGQLFCVEADALCFIFQGRPLILRFKIKSPLRGPHVGAYIKRGEVLLDLL
ncbi:MAG: hypothetical protein ACLUOC_06785, partial [Peptoniphilaceae bacterium]